MAKLKKTDIQDALQGEIAGRDVFEDEYPKHETMRLDEADMDKIAEFIYLCATDFENSAEKIREGVTEICRRHPLYE